MPRHPHPAPNTRGARTRMVMRHLAGRGVRDQRVLAAMRWAPREWFLPLTHFLKVLRGILLKGVGVTELWQEMAILLLFATVLIALSVRRFQKTLD